VTRLRSHGQRARILTRNPTTKGHLDAVEGLEAVSRPPLVAAVPFRW